MKKRIKFSLLTLIILLSSCSSFKNNINSFDMTKYNKDLSSSINMDISSPSDFQLNSYIIEDGNENIYIIQIKYTLVDYNNLYMIMIPSSYDENSLLPCVGYSKSLSLKSEINQKKSYYTGFNLQYKTSIDNLTFKLFVSSDDHEEKLYQVSTFTILEN